MAKMIRDNLAFNTRCMILRERLATLKQVCLDRGPTRIWSQDFTQITMV